MSNEPRDDGAKLVPIVQQTPAVNTLTRRGLDLAISLQHRRPPEEHDDTVDRVTFGRQCLLEARANLREAQDHFWDQAEDDRGARCRDAVCRVYLWGLLASADTSGPASLRPTSLAEASEGIEVVLTADRVELERVFDAARDDVQQLIEIGRLQTDQASFLSALYEVVIGRGPYEHPVDDDMIGAAEIFLRELTAAMQPPTAQSAVPLMADGTAGDRVPVLFLQLGETVETGTIVRWFSQVGDSVSRDRALFEISTDRYDAEIGAPASGVLTEIRVPAGTTIQSNTVVGIIIKELRSD